MFEFQPVETARDHDELVDFLSREEWPFHGKSRLTRDDAAAMDFVSDEAASFWIVDDGERVGLVRAFDVGDIPDGAPLLDIRIAANHRGRGAGSAATRSVVDYLFTTHPRLHRIEANTRHDNVAMQRVLTKVGFTQEGRLRDSWRGDGRYFDTLVYGLLRTD